MDTPSPPVSDLGRKMALMSIVLISLTWAAMSACLNNGFINWDETAYLIRNPFVRSLSIENIKTIFSSSDLHLYTPLSTLSYAVEYHFAGLNPKVYHATNLALHMLSTLLVFAFAWRLLCRFSSAGLTGLSGNARLFIAFGAALFFGIHPAHVESVAWVAERKDTLYAFFFLLSAVLYFIPEREGRRWIYWTSLAAFALSLLSKPMAVTLPAILLAFEFLLEGRLSRRAIVMVAPYALFSLAAVTPMLLAPGIGPHVGLIERFTVPLYNIGYYAGLLLFPVNLSAMHTGVSRLTAMLSAAAVLTALALILRFRRHDRLLMMALCLYIIPLLPVIQIIPFGQFVSADRYTYISSIGFFLLLSVPLSGWLQDASSRARTIACVAAICAALALATAARVRCAVWFNGLTLWRDTLIKSPRSRQAFSNLCSAYINFGQPKKAFPCFEQALKTDGPSAHTYFHMGFIHALNGQSAAAADNFRRTLELDSCHYMALSSLGSLEFSAGRMREAELYFDRAVRCGTDSPIPYYRLAEMAGKRGDKAMAEFYTRYARKLDTAYVPSAR